MNDFGELEIFKHGGGFITSNQADDFSFSEYLRNGCEGLKVFDTALEAVENYARENGLIKSEKELGEYIFNFYILGNESVAKILLNDEPAKSEFTFNIADELAENGNLHREQYNNYSVTISDADLINVIKSK